MGDKEAGFLHNRLLEQAGLCYRRRIPVATDFLDLNGQNIFHSAVREMPPVIWKEMGGYDLAERKLILFIPYEGYPYQTPYGIIEITPSNPKFAEELGHRDYLGALLNLGITREKFGDLIVDNGKAYVFCVNSIADYIADNLTRVRHTLVKTRLLPGRAETSSDGADAALSDPGTEEHGGGTEFDYLPRFKEIRGSVASVRLDAVIALGFGGSRSRLISYIEEGRVAVNGRIITTNGYNLKGNDIISVRGLGKLQFVQVLSGTRKGRSMILLRKYL